MQTSLLPYDRLAKAVFTQALRDATDRAWPYCNKATKRQARAWLLRAGADWAEACNIGITHEDIKKFESRGWKPLEQ